MNRKNELPQLYIEIPGWHIHLRRPRWFVSLPVVVCLIIAVSLLDFAFEPEPEFSIFYLVPITVAVFLLGRAAGILSSCIR